MKLKVIRCLARLMPSETTMAVAVLTAMLALAARAQMVSTPSPTQTPAGGQTAGVMHYSRAVCAVNAVAGHQYNICVVCAGLIQSADSLDVTWQQGTNRGMVYNLTCTATTSGVCYFVANSKSPTTAGKTLTVTVK